MLFRTPTSALTRLGFIIALSLVSPVIQAADTPSPAVEAADPFSDAMKSGRSHVKAKNWGNAVKRFESAVALNDTDADAHNMLAFSLRNKGDLDRAMKHYNIALTLDPKHKGAHEYVGQLFLKLNKLPEAEKHLVTLARLCNKKCEEYDDLAQAVAAYKKK